MNESKIPMSAIWEGTLKFMERVQLTGSEVPSYNLCMQTIWEQINAAKEKEANAAKDKTGE